MKIEIKYFLMKILIYIKEFKKINSLKIYKEKSFVKL